MSSPKQIRIKESIIELRKLQKRSIPMIANRIRVLIEIKKHEASGISKRAVADIVGVNPNSVQTWRSMYLLGGIDAILGYQKREGRPSVLSKEEHYRIEEKLKDPKNGLQGFTELQNWVEQEFEKTILYNTLFKYSQRHFGAKVKVARKSHIKKDEEAVAVFKKTSANSAKMPGKKNKNSSKK
jgi:transposase